MSGFHRFLLIFALCGAVGGAAVWALWSRYGGEVVQEFERVQADALTFAAANPQTECVPEAFGRLSVCDTVWCKVQTPLFTKECLRNAQPSADLCDAVPDSIPSALLWPSRTCADIDAEPQICERILRELMTVCVASPSS